MLGKFGFHRFTNTFYLLKFWVAMLLLRARVFGSKFGPLTSEPNKRKLQQTSALACLTIKEVVSDSARHARRLSLSESCCVDYQTGPPRFLLCRLPCRTSSLFPPSHLCVCVCVCVRVRVRVCAPTRNPHPERPLAGRFEGARRSPGHRGSEACFGSANKMSLCACFSPCYSNGEVYEYCPQPSMARPSEPRQRDEGQPRLVMSAIPPDYRSISSSNRIRP